MLGLIRVRVDENAPRARTERLETIGGVPFQTSVLQVRSLGGMLDCLMMRQSIRLLAMRGVSCAAAPDVPYIKELLARYHIEGLGHWPLLRAVAPQMIDRILEGAPDGAALLYARRLDGDVMAAARYAAQRCRTVVLDFGARGEAVRRRLLDECGTAALLGQVPAGVSCTAALLFDRPLPGFRVRMPRPTVLALCPGASGFADYDDACVRGPLFEPLGDTDREAVLGAIVSRDAAAAEELTIVNFAKK